MSEHQHGGHAPVPPDGPAVPRTGDPGVDEAMDLLRGLVDGPPAGEPAPGAHRELTVLTAVHEVLQQRLTATAG